MLRKTLAVALLLLVACSVVFAGLSCKVWYPWVPLEADPTWEYFVRIWVPDGKGGLRELTRDEFAALGEDQEQTVSVLRYPQKDGTTIYGVYHEELNFVLWMKRFPDKDHKLGELAQVGETPKDTYDPSMTPAENDEAGNIDRFAYKGKWYPRTWTKRISYPGQSWCELWGPFGDPSNPQFLKRQYTVSFEKVCFGGKNYVGVKVRIVGPAEGGPGIAREALTFIDGIGMYERYFDLVQDGKVVFKHIATLQSVKFP